MQQHSLQGLPHSLNCNVTLSARTCPKLTAAWWPEAVQAMVVSTLKQQQQQGQQQKVQV
jgi:hypothetical protein